MKTIVTVLVLLLALVPAVAIAAQEETAPTPSAPPSLDGVTWADRGVTLDGLKGKTVVILVYAMWNPVANEFSSELLGQIKEAIVDKPIVVLAIDADKKAGQAMAYLRERKFIAPNIVHGRDPLMPARLGFKHELFNYVVINPRGEVAYSGEGGQYFNTQPRRYVLPTKLAKARTFGKLRIVDPDMSPKLKAILWPLELGQVTAESDLKLSDLSDEQRKAVGVAIDKYLTQLMKHLKTLAEGEVTDRLAAYEEATRATTGFKGHAQVQELKDLLAELGKDEDLRRELTAKRAYDRVLQQVAKTPASRTKALQSMARLHKGTYYGDLAANDGKPVGARANLKSIRTWPTLTDEEQKEALEKQRTYVNKLQEMVPGVQLKTYETKRFLCFSDLPANVMTGVYLPSLDQMYTQLCEAYGLDPTKNVWKGKATIVAFANQANFATFEAARGEGVPQGVQGVAHLLRDGSVLISCFAGKDPAYFAAVLVHETAHGFTFRYKSGDRVPNWLDEGASEWIADRVVGTNRSIRRRVEEAIQRMRQTNSMGGDFFIVEHLSEWQYGAACSMTDFLLKYDPSGRAKPAGKSARAKSEVNRYRKLMDGIKGGVPWEDALRDAYGLTPEQLVTVYGQSIGAPNLRP